MFIKNQHRNCLVEASGMVLMKQVGFMHVEYTIFIRTPQLREEVLGTYAAEERAKQILGFIADAMLHHEGVYVMPEE